MAFGDVGILVHKSRSKPTLTAVIPPSQGFNSSGGSTGSFGGGSITISSFSEDIVYTKKPRKQRLLANRCIHKRNFFGYGEPIPLPRRVEDLTAGHSGWWTKYYQGHVHSSTAHDFAVLAALAAFTGQTGSGMLGANAQIYINSAWLKCKPDLTMVNIPNFLYEKRNLTSLAHYWRESVGSLKMIKQAVQRKQGVAKALSGGVLGYSFGIAPDVGDVRDIINSVTTLRDRIAEFEKHVGETLKRHFTSYSNSQSITGTFNYQGDAKQPCSWRGTRSQRVTAHFTFVPKPILALNTLDKYLRGVLDSLGFELNPNIIFQAIPFSFLLNWFVDVSTYLEGWKIDALELPVELVDGYLQFTEEIAIDSRLVLDKGSTVSSVNYWPGAATVSRRFERMPILPDYTTMRALDVRWPTFHQAELAFCLAVQFGGKTTRATSSNSFSSPTFSASPISNFTDG